jgi:hypothetical protein
MPPLRNAQQQHLHLLEQEQQQVARRESGRGRVRTRRARALVAPAKGGAGTGGGKAQQFEVETAVSYRCCGHGCGTQQQLELELDDVMSVMRPRAARSSSGRTWSTWRGASTTSCGATRSRSPRISSRSWRDGAIHRPKAPTKSPSYALAASQPATPRSPFRQLAVERFSVPPTWMLQSARPGLRVRAARCPWQHACALMHGPGAARSVAAASTSHAPTRQSFRPRRARAHRRCRVPDGETLHSTAPS